MSDCDFARPQRLISLLLAHETIAARRVAPRWAAYLDRGPVGLISSALLGRKTGNSFRDLHVCMEFTSVQSLARLLNRLTNEIQKDTSFY
jgi:hypothetical protein